MVSNDKERVTIRLDFGLLNECDKNLLSADCKNRTEYIVKALKFYNGINSLEINKDFFGDIITNTISSIIKTSEERISKIQFKQAVELAKISKAVSQIFEYDDEKLLKLHLDSVEEVKKINGILKFEESVKENSEKEK